MENHAIASKRSSAEKDYSVYASIGCPLPPPNGDEIGAWNFGFSTPPPIQKACYTPEFPMGAQQLRVSGIMSQPSSSYILLYVKLPTLPHCSRSLTSEDISTSQGLDYIDFTATVTFQPMTTSSSFVIDIIDDDLLEATESFNVVAFDSSYILFDPQLPLFEVFIYDDDVTHIELTSTVSSLTEGPGVDNRTIITVESSKQVQIGYQSIIVGLDLSLTAGIPNVCGGFVPTSNFMMESYQLTIPPGQQSASTLLSLLDDDIIEVRGCIVISISSVSWGSAEKAYSRRPAPGRPW
ncbi:hypothetical protein BSL78_07826 [Apostichopus japonicus]|uniref:Calx-beta domain-containing protein n=1 Tax=Stichopus japonicus TaxID=307972 RepID=A0A2G8L4Q6_STIJA|nr:hypothetical protein BSL78_07826 [Apostichopus japonicus]